MGSIAPDQTAASLMDTLAVSPCDTERVPNLVQDIARTAQSCNEPGSRLQLLKAARSLVRALETPRETVIRLCWAEVSSIRDVDCWGAG